jgi:hypothetical protein
MEYLIALQNQAKSLGLATTGDAIELEVRIATYQAEVKRVGIKAMIEEEEEEMGPAEWQEMVDELCS